MMFNLDSPNRVFWKVLIVGIWATVVFLTNAWVDDGTNDLKVSYGQVGPSSAKYKRSSNSALLILV